MEDEYDGRFGPIPSNIPMEQHGYWIAAQERAAAERLRKGPNNTRSYRYEMMRRVKAGALEDK